nr:ATP-binding protein [Neobacillus sp. Marseille-Q6967]
MKKQLNQYNALLKSQMDTNGLDIYRRVFEDSMDGLILWDNQYRIVDINSSALKIFGCSRERLIGCLLFDLFKEGKKQEIMNHIQLLKQKGKHCSSLALQLDNGKIKHFDYSTKLGITDGLNQTVIIDVTEKVEMQDQLRKSDRLNIVGELAAGIAHEIRNPMTALKGFIQLLEPCIKEKHSMYYDVISSELARIDSIINEFLILAKPKEIQFLMMDVRKIMKETVDLLSAQAVLFNVVVHTQFEENLPDVFCEPNQLKKVLINIIKNAFEVMPDGGNLFIEIKRSDEYHVQISIKDQGKGIPKDTINKLGEPFYTTKERGTGLGLMVSYRIIEEHHGRIQIESEEGKGAIFHITLPYNHQRLIKEK